MIFARQSTAIIVTIGPCLDADGVADTGVVVAAILISKNGAAPGALNGSATLTHRNTGYYSLSLTATDVNTVGTVEIVINDTTTACPIKEITVVEPATYDVLFADAAPGPASPTNITAGTITTATNVTTVNGLAANVITAASIADGAIDAATFAAGAINAAAIANGAIDAATFAAGAIDAAAIADGAIDAATFAAGAITATVIATGAIDADALSADAGTELGTAVWATASRVLTANTNLNDPTAAAIADAVWDEAIAGHLGAGSTGAALNGAGAAGDPWSTEIPGAYGAGTAGFIIGTNLDATVSSRLATAGYTAPLTAAGTRTAVGLASANLDTQLGDLPTAAEIRVEINANSADLNTLIAGLVTIEGKVDTVDTVVDGVKAKTDSLTFTVAGHLDTNTLKVNGVTVTGSGVPVTDPWLGAP